MRRAAGRNGKLHAYISDYMYYFRIPVFDAFPKWFANTRLASQLLLTSTAGRPPRSKGHDEIASMLLERSEERPARPPLATLPPAHQEAVPPRGQLLESACIRTVTKPM